MCYYCVSAVRSHHWKVWGWDFRTHRPGGTPSSWHAVQWKIRYCVWCNTHSQPHPPDLTPPSTAYLQPSQAASLPAGLSSTQLPHKAAGNRTPMPESRATKTQAEVSPADFPSLFFFFPLEFRLNFSCYSTHYFSELGDPKAHGFNFKVLDVRFFYPGPGRDVLLIA